METTEHLTVGGTVITPAGEGTLTAINGDYGVVLDKNSENHQMHVRAIVPKEKALKFSNQIGLWDRFSLDTRAKIAEQIKLPMIMAERKWNEIDKDTQNVICQRYGIIEYQKVETPQMTCKDCNNVVAKNPVPDVAFEKYTTEVDVCYCEHCGTVFDSAEKAEQHEYLNKHRIANKSVFEKKKSIGDELRDAAVQVGNQAIGGGVLRRTRPPKAPKVPKDTAPKKPKRWNAETGNKPKRKKPKKPKKPV